MQVVSMKRGRPRVVNDDAPVQSPKEQAALKILALYETCEVETIRTKGGRELVRFIPRTGRRAVTVPSRQEGA